MSNKTIFKAVATVTVFSVFTRTLSFLFKIYLSRTLGAEVMGLYQICLTLFFMFSALAASGLPTILSRKTAEAHALDPNNKGYTLVTATMFLGLIVTMVTMLSLYLLKPFLGKIITDSRAIPLFMIMLPALVSTCIYSIIRGWFWGAKKFAFFSITETLEEILRIVFTLLFVSGVVSGINGAYGMALAFTISDITVAIILIIMYFTSGGKLTKKPPLKEVAKPAVPLTAMRFFGSFIGTVIAVLLPARLIAGGVSVNDATASFGRIAGMANPLLFAPNAIISSLAIVLIPEMSESGIKKDFALLNKHINNGITVSVTISGLFLIIYSALGSDITSLIFRDSISGEYLQVASWILLIMPINHIVSSAINSIGMEKEAFFSFLVSTIFMLLSIYFLPQFIGIYAVIVANVVVLLISLIGNSYFLHKKANITFGFLKSPVLVVTFAFPCIFFAKTINQLLSTYIGAFSLVGAIIMASIMYTILVHISGLIDISGFIKLGKNTKLLKRKKTIAVG